MPLPADHFPEGLARIEHEENVIELGQDLQRTLVARDILRVELGDPADGGPAVILPVPDGVEVPEVGRLLDYRNEEVIILGGRDDGNAGIEWRGEVFAEAKRYGPPVGIPWPRRWRHEVDGVDLRDNVLELPKRTAPDYLRVDVPLREHEYARSVSFSRPAVAAHMVHSRSSRMLPALTARAAALRRSDRVYPHGLRATRARIEKADRQHDNEPSRDV